MYFLAWALAALRLAAADPFQIALAARAQSDFDRVELAAAPTLVDAARCVQSQAAVVPVTAPYSLPLIHFRKGYCALTGALISKDAAAFAEAAAAFDQSLATYAAIPRERKAPPEPTPAAVAAVGAIARLASGADGQELVLLDRRLDEARRSGACPAQVMPVPMCLDILAAAAAWQGWIAIKHGRFADASGHFAKHASLGWDVWLAGRRQYEGKRYDAAADAYARAFEIWSATEKNPPRRIPSSLEPPGAPVQALVDLGAARIAAGNLRSAVTALDVAARRDPNRSWTFFLRGRAREDSGDAGGALADYNLAGRTALASQRDDATGAGRFYRGVWSFRRGDAERAEEEFAEALNAGLPSELALDAAAWRALVAVSAGGCEASREKLESVLPGTSPFFPKKEARTALASCPQAPAKLSEVR